MGEISASAIQPMCVPIFANFSWNFEAVYCSSPHSCPSCHKSPPKKTTRMRVSSFFWAQAAETRREPGAVVCICRNTTFAANESHGLIKTPRYPRSYCANLNCNWTIAAGSPSLCSPQQASRMSAGGPDEAIRLHWDQFRLHSADFLLISFVENGVKVPVEKCHTPSSSSFPFSNHAFPGSPARTLAFATLSRPRVGWPLQREAG